MNRTQLVAAVTDKLNSDLDEAEWTKGDVKAVLESFESVVTENVAGGENVVLSGFVKFAHKNTPAKPARMGRNPATGEQIQLKPKPASVTVRTSPLKAFKDAVIAASAPAPSKKKKGKKKKK